VSFRLAPLTARFLGTTLFVDSFLSESIDYYGYYSTGTPVTAAINADVVGTPLNLL
jgi:hypothetical protein